MNPFALYSLSVGMAKLTFDSHCVIAERMSRLARGDTAAGVEAVRMVTEKAFALGEVNARLANAAASGKLDGAMPGIVALYGRKVRANRRRLKC